MIGGGLAGLAAAAALGGAGLCGAPARIAPVPRRPRDLLRNRLAKPSTTASTSCCAAASICWISTAGLAWLATSRFIANSSSSNPAAAAACCAPGSCCPPAHFTGIVPAAEVSESLREAGGLPAAILAIRPRKFAPGSGSHHHAAVAGGKAPAYRARSSASGGRCWSARSTKSWIAWPPRMAFRSSDWDFWPANDSYEMGVPAVPLGELYGSRGLAQRSAMSNFACARRSSKS